MRDLDPLEARCPVLRPSPSASSVSSLTLFLSPRVSGALSAVSRRLLFFSFPLLSLCLSLQSLSASVRLSLGPSFLPSLPCYLLCTCPLSAPLQPHYQALCDVGWGWGPLEWGGTTAEPPKACTQKFEGQWEGHQPREGGRCWRWRSRPGLLGPRERNLGRKGGGPLRGTMPPSRGPSGPRGPGGSTLSGKHGGCCRQLISQLMPVRKEARAAGSGVKSRSWSSSWPHCMNMSESSWSGVSFSVGKRTISLDTARACGTWDIRGCGLGRASPPLPSRGSPGALGSRCA